MRYALIFLLVLICAGCRTMKPTSEGPSPKSLHVTGQPVLRPFAKAEYFFLVEPFVVRVGVGNDSLVVPEGFVTDFASIPPRVRGFLPKLGPHLFPAIVHDYLYWEQTCTRQESDRIFAKMMEEMGTSWVTRKALSWGLFLFGGRGWAENIQNRRSGLNRVVPPGARPIEPYETWPEYRDSSPSGAEITPAAPVISPGFCSYPGTRATAK